MYCPYCNTQHDATTTLSLEHIIPFALGGSDDLTITTCTISNNELGSEVDAPFIDFFPIQSRRFSLGLRSTNGKPPTLDFSGMGWIAGKEVPISYRVSEGNRQLKIDRPQLVKTMGSDGNEVWQIFGDPDKVREIIEGKLRKQTALGKTITLQDGNTLTSNDIDRFIAESVTVTLNPSVLKTIPLDYVMPVRFFCKIALAMGHFHLGESFSRSAWASELRRHMRLDDFEDMHLPGSAIWPNLESVKSVVEFFAREDYHVIAILDGTPPMMVVNLFGEFGSVIPLGEVPQGRSPVVTGNGSVWHIALPSRRLTKLSTIDFFQERAAEMRRRTKQPPNL
jgi:hypothetical protein